MKKIMLHKDALASLQSLSRGMAGDKRFYHRFKIGYSRIQDIGLVPVVSENALKGIEYLANHPEKRAADLMDAFQNDEIKVIIANIGGFDSHLLIPHLDKKIIKKNPKPILGYSDTTSLHLFLYTLGIQTYYGPSVLDGFAENGQMHKTTKQSVEKVLFTQEQQEIKTSPTWTSEFLDWANKSWDNTPRKMQNEEHEHIWLNFEENVKGHLIGGCLDTIMQIKNKAFFPKLEYWKDSVIFLETSEEKMKPQEFTQALNLLKNEISVCQALIFGKPKDEAFFHEYLKILKNKISKPIVFNLNFGHTAPLYTIPYGAIIQLNPQDKKIKIK